MAEYGRKFSDVKCQMKNPFGRATSYLRKKKKSKQIMHKKKKSQKEKKNYQQHQKCFILLRQNNSCISGKERLGLGNESAARVEKINVNTLLTKRLKAQN